MINFFLELNYVWQALLATLFTYGVTALGAMIVFLFKKVNKSVLDAMLGFSAGVMTSASYFSLIAPAISMSEILNLGNVIVLLGFLCGGFLLFIGDKVCDRLINSKNKRVLMLISSITLHNIPEDCSPHVSQLKYNIGLKLKTTKIIYIIILVVYLVFISVISIHLPFVF